jgi:O-antigen ligase/Flp pilus assembly protein TadD
LSSIREVVMTGYKATRDKWGERLDSLIKVGVPVLLALIPLIYGPYFSDYFAPKFALLHAGVGLLVGLWIVRCGVAGHLQLLRRPYYLPVAAYAGASFFSLLWAVNPRQGFEVWLFQVWLLAFFLLVAHHIRSARAVWVILWTIASVSLLVSVLGLLQYAGVHLIPFPHARWGNFGVSTLGNPNFVAHYLELAIILVAGMLLARQKVWERVALGFLLVVEVYYLLMTRSRGGWLAVGVGLVALFLFYRPRVGRRILLVGASATLVLVLVGQVVLDRVPAPGGPLGEIREIRDRALSSFDLEHFSVLQRRLIWADTVALIADQALLGVGTGNFEFWLPAYRTASRHRAWDELIANRPHMPYYAHNEYLEIWSENGIFGLVAVLWLLVVLLRVGWHSLKAQQESESQALQAGFLAAMCAALTHSLFSLNFQDPTSSLHFWLIAGLAVGRGTKGEGALRVWNLGSRGRLFIAGAAIPVVVGAYGGLCILIADYYYFEGQKRYYDYKQPNRASLALEKAISWREYEFKYHHMLGLVLLEGRRPVEAARALERAQELHPNNAAALRLWGQALYWVRREGEAIAALRRAIALDPLDREPYALLARSYHDEGLRYKGEGDPGRARESFLRAIKAWKQALAFAPEDVGSLRGLGIEYFAAGLLDNAEAALVQAARLSPGDGLIEGNLGAVYLGQGRLPEAEAALMRAVAVDSVRAEWRGNLALLYEKQGRLPEAEAALVRATQADPANLRWHLRLIELLRKQGEIEAALRAAEVALVKQPQSERMAQMLRELRLHLQKGEP